MLFIKIDSFGVYTDICNQVDDNYVNYFGGDFTFVIFADEKDKFLFHFNSSRV